MALKRASMVATTSGTDGLSLTVPSGESLRVREINVTFDAAGAEDIKVTINRKTIQQFKVPSTWGLLARIKDDSQKSMIMEMRKLGLLEPIPVGEGETLEITAPGSSNYLEIVYDLYDAGDVSPSEYNGSDSNAYDFFQVISNSAAISASGDVALDQSDLDAIFPAFPGGKVVPANYEMELRAMFGDPAYKDDGAAAVMVTTHVKFLLDREDIFDKDLTGILFGSRVVTQDDAVHYQNLNSRIHRGGADVYPGILVLEQPIVFRPGDELNVSVTCVETGAIEFLAASVKLGLLFNVRRLS